MFKKKLFILIKFSSNVQVAMRMQESNMKNVYNFSPTTQ